MVNVPVRASPGFSEIATATVPVPVPLVGDVTVKKLALEVTVHAQPLFVVTPIDAVPPTPAILNAVLPSTYEHAAVGGGVAVGDEGVLEHAAASATNHTHRITSNVRRTTHPP